MGGLNHGAGEKNNAWTGGRRHGAYDSVLCHNHQRADKKGYVLEHILIAEKALKKPLPPKAQVHHANENKKDNNSSNLVICQNEAYHRLLHKRARAFRASGHADWLKCQFCKEHDDPYNLYIFRNGTMGWHRKCHALYEKNRKEKSNEPKQQSI